MTGGPLRRLGAAVLGSALITVTLTGCSKEADGAVAIGQNAEGEVIVQVVTCQYPATELALLLEQDGADPYQDVTATALDQPAGTSQTYTLAELFGETRASSLTATAPYHLRGTVTDEDGRRDMNGVSFTLAEVAEQEAGEVIGNDVDAPVPAETFTSQACDDDAAAPEKPQ